MCCAHAEGGWTNMLTSLDPGWSHRELNGRRSRVGGETIVFKLVAMRSNDRGRDHSWMASRPAAATTSVGVLWSCTSRQRERTSASLRIGSDLGTQQTASTTECWMHHSKTRRSKDWSNALLLPLRMESQATAESVNTTMRAGIGPGMLRSI